MQDRLKSLHDLVLHGINRNSSDNDFLTLPIFHAFSVEQEIFDNKAQAAQKNLLSSHVKPAEYVKLDGQVIEDVLEPCDVAMIITVIANNLVS